MSNKKKIENKAIEEAVRAFAEGHTTQVNEQEAEKKISDQKQETVKNTEENRFKFDLKKENREKKTKHFQLLLKPSIYNSVKEISEDYAISMNELINQVLEGFSNYMKGEE